MAENLLGNLLWSFGLVSFFTQLDEVGIFGEAASIEVTGNAVPAADRAHLPDIFHRNRLPSAGIIGYGEHHQRDSLPPNPTNQFLQRSHVHVSLKWMFVAGFASFGNQQIDCFSAYKLDICPRGIEMRVVGNNVTFLASDSEKNSLSGASLM